MTDGDNRYVMAREVLTSNSGHLQAQGSWVAIRELHGGYAKAEAEVEAANVRDEEQGGAGTYFLTTVGELNRHNARYAGETARIHRQHTLDSM